PAAARGRPEGHRVDRVEPGGGLPHPALPALAGADPDSGAHRSAGACAARSRAARRQGDRAAPELTRRPLLGSASSTRRNALIVLCAGLAALALAAPAFAASG